MDLGIRGKRALVGGASKGLGLGCAEALATEGVHVLLVTRQSTNPTTIDLQILVPVCSLLPVACR